MEGFDGRDPWIYGKVVGYRIDDFEKEIDDEYITMVQPNRRDGKINGKVSRIEIYRGSC